MTYTYDLSTIQATALIVGVLWELFWKGAAMWRAAMLDEPIWFTFMLVVSSMGALPIFYLLTHQEHSHSPVAHRGTA